MFCRIWFLWRKISDEDESMRETEKEKWKWCALALATRSLAIVYNENAIKRKRKNERDRKIKKKAMKNQHQKQRRTRKEKKRKAKHIDPWTHLTHSNRQPQHQQHQQVNTFHDAKNVQMLKVFRWAKDTTRRMIESEWRVSGECDRQRESIQWTEKNGKYICLVEDIWLYEILE